VIAQAVNLAGALARTRYFYPLGILLLTLIGGLIRFGNLTNPTVLMFDETYYVKDAYTLGLFGSEREWPEGANTAFEAGDLTGFLTEAAYVVHPPIGKWVIWLGMELFGADNTLGWRFSVALLGALAIPLVIAIANRLIGNRFFALVAGLFLAIEGLAIVMSRTAILDGILMFFVLSAFYFLVRDIEHWRSRMNRLHSNSLALRPWLIPMAIALGLATGVKWSGLYFIAFFGLYTFVSDLIIRKRLGLPPVLAIGQGFVNALTLLSISLATYIAGWSGWILGNDGWGRQPERGWIAPLWEYHQNAYSFHTGLATEHPYMSNALEWLPMLRPVAFYFERDETGESCASLPECNEAITAIPNLVIWYGGLLAILWLVARQLRRVRLAELAILTGFLAGWLPWVFYPDRTIFIFYAVVLSPFLSLALSYSLHHYWRKGLVRNLPWRSGRIMVLIVLAMLFALYFLSIWMGYETPYWVWRGQMWFPWWI
jgi:dolichyl-phosphate-mannose--protein O-mannosyl transferase